VPCVGVCCVRRRLRAVRLADRSCRVVLQGSGCLCYVREILARRRLSFELGCRSKREVVLITDNFCERKI